MNRELTTRQSFRFGELSAEQYAAELAERNAAWQSLTPEAQLADLDRRLGVGQGAKRQRAVIFARIEKARQPVTPVIIAGVGADVTALKASVTPSKRHKNDTKGRK